jgi:hypothetical protein
VKRKAWVILAMAIAVALAWTRGPVAAQDTGLTMRVTVGFDGYCHSGTWCPVYAVLSNEGVDIEGELRVAIRGAGGGTEPVMYARQVVLPAHSRKAYFLYLPPAGVSSSLPTVQLLTGKKVLMSEQAVVVWLDEGDRLYGVASSNPSALNFLSDVTPAGGRAAVAHLNLEALPPNPLGWEGLDVLILNDLDTTALSGERRRALETWVVHGGHLVVGGGAGVARTVAGVADLLPVTVGGTRSVDDLWVLGERLGTPVAASSYAVAQADLRDGQALIEQSDEQGDLILLARRTHGAGRVDFLAFDAGLNPFLRWSDNTRLWKFVIGPGAAGTWLLTVRNGHSAYEAINAIPGLELPSTLYILGFMLVYTLLIGPVNYLILRRLDRRELAWLTIPALVVGFTACAYVTGFQIRGGAAIVHRLAAVYVPEGARIGRVSQVVGLFSPRRADYDVWVAGAEVSEVPGDYYGGPIQQPLHIIEAAEGSTVADLRVDVGGIQPFLAEGYADVPGVEADLRLVESAAGGLRLEGTVRNGEVPLNEVVLIVGDGGQRLGDLEPGQVTSISVVIGSSLPPFEDMPERILGPGSYWDDRSLYRRYQFLQALFPYGEPALTGAGVYLVGWVEEEAPLLVEVVEPPGLKTSTVETALYVHALPVAELGTGGAITIGPGLIERQVVDTRGRVEVWPRGFHMEPEAEVVFRFTVWPGVTVGQVDELVLDLQGGGYGSASRPPAISLWNQNSEDWDRLDVGWGRHSISNAGAYVTSPGEVLLRLETSSEGWADVESLTITIKGRR